MPTDFGNLLKLAVIYSRALLSGMGPPRPIPPNDGLVEARLAADAAAKTDAMNAMVKNWADGAGPLNMVWDHSQDPAYQLSLVARKILSFPKEQWPHLVNAEGVQFRELHALLHKVDKQGARALTVDEMTRFNALAAEVMGSEAGGAVGDVADPVAPVELLSSPPWSKKIRPAVKECLLAYLNVKIEDFTPNESYKRDPGKLALLVRQQIVIAMKSKKDPFEPKEGRWPVGRTAGKVMLITFDGDENPTKNGRKPRES